MVLALAGPQRPSTSKWLVLAASEATTSATGAGRHNRALEPSIFDSLLGLGGEQQQPNNANSVAPAPSPAGQPGAASSGESSPPKNGHSQALAATSDKVTLAGDILLGGLFPIHMKGE